MIKAVIFDLDDTLISERQYIASGFRHVANSLNAYIKFDADRIFIELMNLFEQNPKNVFNRILEQFQVNYSDDLIRNLVDEHRTHEPNIQFYDDVIPCTEFLKLNSIHTGIITDGYAVSQRKKLSAVQAQNFFNEIIVTDELGRDYWKPHPKAFDLIREKLGIEYSEMIYVGDNPEKDFHIGSIRPIKTVRIMRNGVYQDRSYFEGIKEKYAIKSLLDIYSLVEPIK